MKDRRGRKSKRPKRSKFKRVPFDLIKKTTSSTGSSLSSTVAAEPEENESLALQRPSKRKQALAGLSYLQLKLRGVNKIVLACILLSLTCVATFLFLNRDSLITINGELSGLESINLRFKNFQTEGYSPVCGCYKEQPAEDWRGVTFAARHINIERTGRLPLTAYMITVAAPRRITWSSPGERFAVDLYFISIPKSEVFNSKSLITKSIPASYQIIAKKHFDPQRLFMIFSEEDLNVDMHGEKPLGAWIPGDLSSVDIGSSKGMFPSAKTVGSITEQYNLKYSDSELQELVGVPLGDFLGPNIVLWNLDAKASVMVGKEMFGVPNAVGESQIVTALVANPPFALRVACIPEALDAVQTYTDLINDAKVKKAKEDYIPMVRHPEDEAGAVHISIPDIEDEAGEFTQIYKRMKENDIVRIPNVPGDFIMVDADTGKELNRFKNMPWMEFRYPPIPPNPGFNVFGSFSGMTFNRVKGRVLTGSRVFNIEVPSDLELRDINSLEVQGGVIQVPLRWDLKSNTADIQLRATAFASLNGEPLAKRFELYRAQVEYILLFSAVLSAMAAVVQVLIARRSIKNIGDRRKVRGKKV